VLVVTGMAKWVDHVPKPKIARPDYRGGTAAVRKWERTVDWVFSSPFFIKPSSDLQFMSQTARFYLEEESSAESLTESAAP